MYLSLCLIAKDENVYLKEWLDYHILAGVEHFWIYDNDSKVPLASTIKEYIKKGWVTLNAIHGKAVQLYAYDHCIKTYGHFSKWMGFIDTDEFIVPKTGTDIKDFLKGFENYAGLSLSSLFFGSSSHPSRPECGQIAGYTMRTPESLSKNRFIKSIIQPDKVVFPVSPHSFMYTEGQFCVNENFARVSSQFFPCNVNKIQLNHYYTRSAQEWKEKKLRGRGDSGNPYEDDAWVDLNKNSIVNDEMIIRRTIQLLNLPPAIAGNFTALTDPMSTRFLKELSGGAGKISPPPCTAVPADDIFHDPELEQLLADYTASMDLVAEKQFEQARVIYARLLQKYPSEVIQYTNYAITCIYMGDLPSAWEVLAQAWRMSPRDLTVLQCMNDYFFAAGNFDQVEKTCLLMETHGSLEPITVAGLAIARWELGKHEQALETARLILPQLTPAAIANSGRYKRLYDLMGNQDQVTNDAK